jgi:hypothetical protein
MICHAARTYLSLLLIICIFFVLNNCVTIFAIYERRCCYNSRGVALKKCKCLNDDEQTSMYDLQKGKETFFHWRLANLDYINVPDEIRPNITFILSPCSGSMHLYVKPLDSNFTLIREKTYWYKSTISKDVNEIHIPLLYSDYSVVVYAENSGNFSMLTTVSDHIIPRPGMSGKIEINQSQHYSLDLSFYSPPIYINNYRNNYKNLGQLEYTIYYFRYNDVKHNYNCVNSTNTKQCYNTPIVWTPCGLESSSPIQTKKFEYNNMIRIKKLISEDNNEDAASIYDHSNNNNNIGNNIKVVKHKVVFDNLPLEQDLFFNIIVHSKNHSLKMAYRGIRTSLHFDRISMQVDSSIMDTVTSSVFYTIVVAISLSIIIRLLFQHTTYRSVTKQMKAMYLKNKAKQILTKKSSSYISNAADNIENDDDEKKDEGLGGQESQVQRNSSVDTASSYRDHEYVFSEDGSTPRSPYSPQNSKFFSGDENDNENDPLSNASPARSEEAELLDSLLEATSPDKD